jgi:transposase
MWTAQNRRRYDRSQLRYPSDLTDDEWAHVEPLIPPAKRGGNRRHVDVREVMNGIMYILSTGCQWRAIPKDLPPRPVPPGAFFFGSSNCPTRNDFRDGLLSASTNLRRPRWVLCHEYRRSTRRYATVREMKEGPSRSAIRC